MLVGNKYKINTCVLCVLQICFLISVLIYILHSIPVFLNIKVTFLEEICVYCHTLSHSQVWLQASVQIFSIQLSPIYHFHLLLPSFLSFNFSLDFSITLPHHHLPIPHLSICPCLVWSFYISSHLSCTSSIHCTSCQSFLSLPIHLSVPLLSIHLFFLEAF